MTRFSILALLLTLTSCAGIINGTSQTVSFTSEPSRANVIIDGQNRGRTPLTVKLKKNKYDNIMIKKKGYHAQSRPLEKKYDATALLNIFWDSSTTDLISGAAYEYEPNSYHFVLERDGKKKRRSKKRRRSKRKSNIEDVDLEDDEDEEDDDA